MGARALGGGARGANRHDPLGTRDAAPSEVLTNNAIAAPTPSGITGSAIGVIDGAIDGSTLASTGTRAIVTAPVLIVAANDALGAAFSSDDAVRLT